MSFRIKMYFCTVIYPSSFEEKIGFKKIRQSLEMHCQSAIGKRFAEKMNFSESTVHIERCLRQTEEYRQIILFEDKKPYGDIFDVIEELRRIRTIGTFMEPEALTELRITLTSILVMCDFLKSKALEDKYPELNLLAETIDINPALSGRIEHIIDEKGEIRDNASEHLADTRRKIRSAQSDSEKKLRQVLKQAKKAGWTPEDVEPGIRNGRMVIPMQAAHRRQIEGFVQDESATGQTVYIEPAAVLENNNKIRKLEHEERREIIRILTAITDDIRPESESILEGLRFIGMLDFIRAKAKYAIETESRKPLIFSDYQIKWKSAIHPLLHLKLKKEDKKVIPLDIELNSEERILVISGPNAGGKSVCLKTIGLLQYMLQCGMLVPAKEESGSCVFSDLFVDIGDEQSIENDLSTYSSHLVGMKKLMQVAGKKTLFLIDEFGTGTEPHLGGAIAESVLEFLEEKQSMGVVTTHYSNLKLLADKHKAIINGAMLFDTKSMAPLYTLKTGKPGSSFAFEIAAKIGFPKQLLKEAEKKSGSKHFSFDQQLQQLEIDKKELDKKQIKVDVADAFLTEIIAKYEALNSDLQQKKQDILAEARKEAENILKGTNKTIENLIREIRESQAEKEKTKALRAKLEKEKERIRKESESAKKAKSKLLLKKGALEKKAERVVPLKKGDPVRLKQQKAVGEIIQLLGDEAMVSFDSFKLKTPLDRLEYYSGKVPSRTSGTNYSSIVHDLHKRATNFDLKLDVRGKRTDEALDLVRKFIDDASLLSIHELRILHGKGNGILRMMIREQLLKTPEVEKAEDEHLEFGGHGITVVKLR